MPSYYSEDQSAEQAAFLAKKLKEASENTRISSKNDNTLSREPDGLYVPANFTFNVLTEDLISRDANNDLRMGSDDKLLSKPVDIDFLAAYILASN